MSKVTDIIIALGTSMFILILWAYEMLITSDIPVVYSFRNSVSISCMLFLFFVVYSFYIKNTKYIQLNIIFLVLPLFLWFIFMLQALIAHYHKYETIVCIIGFSVVFVPFIQLIYWKVKKINTGVEPH
ncbi:hypothetical protein [Clostridium tagluense]|uniref:hypothetical protein n=1 Tax=Clostridium tagluense TaxID=360422 RepID=UPI001C6E48E3|nr:hypothetical protein [Clostridium tagluense]MBW9159463.1 hypothetical protein [Clostridium tagluense]WLC68471.1 hypothetical protein KTC93_25495 [Clostridium tagluense]